MSNLVNVSASQPKPEVSEKSPHPGQPPFANMIWIPGGTFHMGAEDFYPEERPVHEVTVDGFWIDRHLITNEQFALCGGD